MRIEKRDETTLTSTINQAGQRLLELQNSSEGYWYFTLEANESIGAGFIQLMHFLGAVDMEVQKGIQNRILQTQKEDGSWGLYYSAPGDLSTTVECYFALKLSGLAENRPSMIKARQYILTAGGLTRVRIFTRVHLALFGLADWNVCPSMPVEMMLLPPWAPMNIYNFSSWARASIVPLLVVFNKRPVLPSPVSLDELYAEPHGKRAWRHLRETSPFSIDRLFLLADKGIKTIGKLPLKKPWRKWAFERAIQWTWEHLQKTEDIYPALAYGAMAFKAYGYAADSKEIQTALRALKSFQQRYVGPELPSRPEENNEIGGTVHQQCCISPVWDTPWSCVALMESGVLKPDDPRLLRASRWLLLKEVRNPNGDWRFKNPEGESGGWSFEFKNEYFPDVDDTIEVIHTLRQAALPAAEKEPAIRRGLNWIRSMQNDDGGWGAFDKNNDLDLVNKIPFADHGACLDPSSPDITGRVVELFLRLSGENRNPVEDPMIKKALTYLQKSQEKFGGWFGRWGVNYIYGTWGVLTGLSLLGPEKNRFQKETDKACQWLESIQNEDGGFSESPESYATKSYLPYPESTASQTAWALMGLIAGGRQNSIAAQRAADYLIHTCEEGLWRENYFTGTGFPGHFYIRYHGYRHYFPLLALGRLKAAL